EEQVAQATEALESASEQQLELEEELNDVVPQADAAQKLWFDLSTLVERLAATSRIAEERANNAGAVTKYQGQDPDDLEARASQADEEHAELVFAAEEAAEALESIREEVAERREAFTAADKEHAAQLRAIADRREGVVRLIAEEEALSRQVEASEQALAHSEDGVNEAAQKLRLARQEASEVEKKLADFDRERAPLDEAHVRALSESQAADLRSEQVRDQQREFERTVYTLRSRIETFTRTIPPTAEIGIALQPLAQLISTQYDVALAVALGQFAESQVGEVGADLVTALENAQRTTVFDNAGGGKTQWRMEANLPKGTSWLLDHIVAVSEVSHGVTRVLADVVLVDDFATARQVVNEDPRLRAVTPDGVMVGEGWVSAGTGSQSTVEVTTKIKTAEQELETAAQDLTELSGTLEGAKLAAEDAQVTAAGAKAALRDHDAQVSAWKRDHQRLLSQVETSQKEHTKLAERATELDVSLAKLREQLSEARDRLARVDKDEPDTEASTSERDAASTALDAAKTMEMEAQMSLRSAQDKVGHAAGRGDSLRRLAQQEREAKARHDRTMERRRALGELARTVAAHAKPLGERA